MGFELLCTSISPTELSLFIYDNVNSVLHSMTPLTLVLFIIMNIKLLIITTLRKTSIVEAILNFKWVLGHNFLGQLIDILPLAHCNRVNNLLYI